MASTHSFMPNASPTSGQKLNAWIVRQRHPLSLVFILLSILYIGFFPLVNVTSGELKPRGTFISENALMSTLGNQGFDKSHLAVGVGAHEQFVAAHPATARAAAEFFRASFTAMGLEAFIQVYPVTRLRWDVRSRSSPSTLGGDTEGGMQERFNVYAVLRAGGELPAQDALLFASTYPTHASQAISPSRNPSSTEDAASTPRETPSLVDHLEERSTTAGVPHAAFLLLSVAARLQQVPWRGKDIVFLLTGDEADAASVARCSEQAIAERVAAGQSMALGCSASVLPWDRLPDSSLGLAAWLRMWNYDVLTEASTGLTERAARWIDPAIWFQWVSVLADPWAPHATEILQAHRRSVAKGGWPSWVRPPAFSSGPFRAALFVSVSPSLVPVASSAVLPTGIRGLMPDMDMYAMAEKAWGVAVGYGADVVHPGMSVVRPRDKGTGPHGDNEEQSPLRPGHEALGKRKAQALGNFNAGYSHPPRATYNDTLERVVTSAHMLLRRQVCNEGKCMVATDTWLERLHTAARFTGTQLWGSSGPHGALLGSNIQSVTLQAVHPPVPPQAVVVGQNGEGEVSAARESAVRIGRSLEKLARAFTGLDERLHAAPPFYLLMSRDTFVGLTEYALPTGIAYLPTLLNVLNDVPTTGGALYGAATFYLSVLFGCVAYGLLMNDALLGVIHGLLGGMTRRIFGMGDQDSSTDPAAAVASWWIAIGLLELALSAFIWPVWRWLWVRLLTMPTSSARLSSQRHEKLDTNAGAKLASGIQAQIEGRRQVALVPVRYTGTRDVLLYCWLAQGYAAFPLLYLNWPLLMLLTWVMSPFLLLMHWMHTRAEERQSEPKGGTSDTRWHLTALWLLSSPLGVAAVCALAGYVDNSAHTWAGGLALARQLHGQESALQVPVLTLLVLPIHFSLASGRVAQN